MSLQKVPETYAVNESASSANENESFYALDYIIPSYLSDVSGYETYEQLYYLAEVIGPRRFGSGQCLPAASYIAEQFQSFGLEVEWEDFTVTTRIATCSIVAPTELERDILDVNPDTQSPDTPGVQAQVTYVYLDSTDVEAEFQPVEGTLPGTIAFIEILSSIWSTTFYRSATVEAATHGAVAVLAYRHDPGWVTSGDGGGADVSETGTAAPLAVLPIPCITLSYSMGYPSEDAEFLKVHWDEVTLSISIGSQDVTGYNVIGTLEGTLEPQKYIIISGHYDTKGMRIQGGNDDTTGTATTLEAARVLSKFHPDVTIKFIAWDGEEGIGTLGYDLGSRAYRDAHMDDIEEGLILAIMAFDWSGLNYPDFPLSLYTRPVAARSPLFSNRNWDDFTAEEKARFNEFVSLNEAIVFDELEFPEGIYTPGYVGVRDDTHYWSDHAPFTTLGVPGWEFLGAEPADYPVYHTPGDNLDTLIEISGGLDRLAYHLRVSGVIAGTLALEIAKVRLSDAIRAAGEYFNKAASCLTLSGNKALKEIKEAYKAGEDYEAVANSWITILRDMTRRFVKALELDLNIVKPEERQVLSKIIDTKTSWLENKELLIESLIQKLLNFLG